MELTHDKEFQKQVDGVLKEHFGDILHGCRVRTYLDEQERKNSTAPPMKITRAHAVVKHEMGFDIVLIARQTQLEHLAGEEIDRWLLRCLGRIDEKDGIFSVRAPDAALSRAEIAIMGIPEEVQRWTQAPLFEEEGVSEEVH